MFTIKKLLELWKADRRYAMRYLLVFTGSTFIHVVLMVMFLVLGRTELAILNGVSLGVYVLWLMWFSRQRINDLMLFVLYLDVVVHACVYNVFLGQDAGFFLYPFIIIPVTFFFSTRDLRYKLAMVNSVALSLLSVWAMLISLTVGPLRPLAEGDVQMIFQINVLFCALLLSVYTSDFMTETLHTQDTLSIHAETDQLTGLRNRYGIQKLTANIHGTQYCVVMCDIDNFKQVNDRYGHDVGDSILRRIGRLLQDNLNRDDIVCRWGGEEFLMILRADLETAKTYVEDIRYLLPQAVVETEDGDLSVTMTFGIASSMEADTFDVLVKIADANLYRGKRSGKDCIIVSSSNTQEIGTPLPRHGAELDTTALNERIFEAFAATSDSTYLYVCNMETNVSRWSQTAVEYFGLPGEYMLDAGNIWLGFIHPDDREAYSQDINDVFAGRKKYHDVSYRARNRNGEYVHLSCRGVITDGDNEHPALFTGTITNLGLSSDAKKR